MTDETPTRSNWPFLMIRLDLARAISFAGMTPVEQRIIEFLQERSYLDARRQRLPDPLPVQITKSALARAIRCDRKATRESLERLTESEVITLSDEGYRITSNYHRWTNRHALSEADLAAADSAAGGASRPQAGGASRPQAGGASRPQAGGASRPQAQPAPPRPPHSRARASEDSGRLKKTTTDGPSFDVPGLPVRITPDSLLLLDSPFQILRSEGITEKTAADLAGRVADEDLARLLMHAHELAAKGKLKNRAGYLRRGIESGFESIPTVEAAIKSRRRQLASEEADARRRREADAAKARHDDAGEAIRRLPPAALEALISEAVASIPPPLVRKDQTIGNPFVRAAVANLLLADHQST